MAPSGRKPKPAGQAVTRHARGYGWIDIAQVPFKGPKLPPRRRDGRIFSANQRSLHGKRRAASASE
jgi:hypothetical protein